MGETVRQARLTIRREGGVRTLTIDSPETLNAVDEATLTALAQAVATPDPEDRVIVLRGSGRAFCSGADLGAIADADNTGAPTLDAANRLVLELTRSPLPVVSVIQGPCAGIGVSLALAADLVVASAAAYFQLAFARVGLMPDGGATALVAASIGRGTALRLALLAERLSAAEALSLGLVARVAPAEELESVVAEVVATLAGGPAAALARTKAAINQATLPHLPAALETERGGQLGLLRGGDFVEGVTAFRERRPAVFTDTPG
ncbi:enoyl-CoA hydratase-related protein [Granulicoccus phenolivorans]|uniref:enoyl-CoA hydratase-related protein n=1 Tax=Granulicoccus phenolivorans TaxID=266854 RepID=UPI00041D32BD|nr:enoyl-CoA hydratase-related protein [Granulicoccus phenolivorans]